jgi:uncharacterized membrane protein
MGRSPPWDALQNATEFTPRKQEKIAWPPVKRGTAEFRQRTVSAISYFLTRNGVGDTSLAVSATFVLVLAFAIGMVSGMRSLTAPAVTAWAGHRNWLNLAGTRLAFMGSTAAVAIFTVLAIVELIVDKLPSTPSRTAPVGLTARFVCGALSGASVGVSAGQSLAPGAILGAAGGLAGAFAGYQWRTDLVKALKVPDFVIALVEDAIAIGAGLFLVSRH